MLHRIGTTVAGEERSTICEHFAQAERFLINVEGLMIMRRESFTHSRTALESQSMLIVGKRYCTWKTYITGKAHVPPSHDRGELSIGAHLPLAIILIISLALESLHRALDTLNHIIVHVRVTTKSERRNTVPEGCATG